MMANVSESTTVPEQVLRFLVPGCCCGERLDVWLARKVPEQSRSQVGRLIQEGRVTVGGRPTKPGRRLQTGEEVAVRLPRPLPPHPQPEPEALPVAVLYEDEHLLVLNKPRDLVVHPAAGSPTGTLVNALLARGQPLSRAGGEDRPGIVHRLDRHTSGVMVVAKDDQTHAALKAQLADRRMHKEYLALVNGAPRQPEGRIEAPLARHPRNRKKMTVVEFGGREAVTDYALERSWGPFSLVRAFPRTGRTHQVRVHLAFVHCPLVGDATYGGRKRAENWARQHRDEALLTLLQTLPGQALHAQRLGFVHPRSQHWVTFSAPVPTEMAALIDYLNGRDF